MNYKEWAYFLKDRIGRIDKQRFIDLREVKQAMGIAFEQLMFETDEKNMDAIYDYYAKEYAAVDITLNTDTLRYEADYPVSVIMTPGSKKMLQKSVRSANMNAGEDLEMVPITEKEYYYWAQQDSLTSDDDNVLTIDSTIRFMTLSNKIVFVAGISEDDAILDAGVRLKLVPKLENYADTEDLVIPDNRARDFSVYVLELLGITPPVDLKDDI